MKQDLPSRNTCKPVTLSISHSTTEPHSTFPAYGIGAVGLFHALWVSDYLEALYVAPRCLQQPKNRVLRVLVADGVAVRLGDTREPPPGTVRLPMRVVSSSLSRCHHEPVRPHLRAVGTGVPFLWLIITKSSHVRCAAVPGRLVFRGALPPGVHVCATKA